MIDMSGTVNKNCEDMVVIGPVMEHGATIKHRQGAVIIIQPPPFLHPVMENYRDQLNENYRQAIRMLLRRG